jgi:HAD superfamily hydrolase (TIGR01509 family)
MIQGVIFDFDGLILNTEEAEYTAWEEIYQSFGAHLPEEDFALPMGTSTKEFDVIAILERETGQFHDEAALKAKAHRRFHELLALEKARPGAADYLRQAKMMGMPVALATSSTRDWVEGHLKRLGLWEFFDVICTADDVVQVKPDPELFLLAAARLMLSPEQTIVFEDSANGIRAAKAAGCYCVAVPHRLSNLNGRGAADRVIFSMTEITLEALIAETNRLFQ